MPQRILDIVTEHPKEQHVAGQMPEIAMQEGIGQIGGIIGYEHQVRRQMRIVESDCRDVAQAHRRGIGDLLGRQQRPGQQPDDGIDDDQADRDVLDFDMLERIRVVQRYEHRRVGSSKR